MIKFKKSMILLVLAVFIFGMASVCASNMNDKIVASEDIGQTILATSNEMTGDNLQLSEENNTLTQANNDMKTNADVLQAGEEGSYSDLRNDIANGGILTKSIYYYHDGDGNTIEIKTPNMVIEGNGAVIDMAGSTNMRAFYVGESNVTFKNLTIKNAKFNKNGGAIYFSLSGMLINCNFTDNYATYGGAIRANARSTVSKCDFTNNKAEYSGAVFFNTTGTVTNSNFTNNKAEYSGAVFFNTTGTVTNSNFTNNKATGENSYGGAVYFFNNGNVTNSNFADNKATENGGAIYIMENGDVTNCNFTNNNASHYGGAIYFAEDSTGEVINCNFTGNNASRYGGAIYFAEDSTGEVINCNFNNNKVTNDYSYGSAVYFENNGNVANCNFTNNNAEIGGAVRMDSGNVENCNFVNNTATKHSGAVYFNNNGNVTNCNFTNNKATGENSYGGAVYFFNKGNVTNSNFANNNAEIGGAVRMDSGSVENCNFTNNKATKNGGAVYFNSEGTVTNSNFADNKATENSGAVYFNSEGTVTNSNFTGNNASTGSAIYFQSSSATKSVSNSIFLNNRANATALEVTKNENNITITFTGNDNLLNAINSKNDAEVTFTNVTYWGVNGITKTGNSSIKPSRTNREVGQNITVYAIVNNEIVLNDVLITDENGAIILKITEGDNYYIIARHDTDSYYTGVETINTNIKFYVNVTSISTNNLTVNLTSKSNIHNDIIPGKLLFILPNGTTINATYGTNGTWWAVHTFEDYDVYQINASYVGLDNVTVNNGTVTITRANSTIILDDIVLNYSESINVTVTTEGATAITAKIDGNDVEVNNFTIHISGLSSGNHTLTVTTIPDKDHVSVNKTVKITVNKATAEIILTNETLDLKVNDTVSDFAHLTPADAGTLNYTSSNDKIVKVVDGKIIALKVGKANITVSFYGNENYTACEDKIIAVSVTLIDTKVIVENNTLDLKVDDTFDLNATAVPEILDIRYSSSNESVAIVNDEGIVTAVGEGTAIITLTVGDDIIYALNSTTVNVIVNKINTTITVNDKVDMKVGDGVDANATLTPADAGTLNYNSSNYSVVKVENGKLIAVGEGTATVTVSYAGNNKYNAAENKTITVTVSLNDASVTAQDITLDVGANATINVTTNPKGLNVTYTPDDSGIVTVENGIVTAIKNGTAKITLTVGGDGKYAENSTTITVTVNKIPTEITVANATLNVKVLNFTHINATLTPGEAGKLIYTSSNSSVVKVIGDLLIHMGKGTAVITVSFDGNDKYAAAESKTIIVNVSLNDASVSVDNDTLDLFVEDKYAINTTTVPEVAKRFNLTYTSSNNSVATVDSNGTVTAVGEGTAIITVEVGDDEVFAKNSTTVTVNVKDKTINVSAPDVTKYFHGDERFVVIVTDYKNNPLANQSVKISVNGINYTRTTDKNGIASIAIGLVSGQYNVTTIACNNTVHSKITVLPTVNATNLVKVFRNGTQFYATFKDSKGNYLDDGTTVRFNIHGVLYDRKVSGDKGLAKLNINLEPGQYIITSMNLKTGETIANNVTVISRLIENKDITKYYRNATQYTVKVIDDTGKAVGAGESVTFNINGVLYTRQTDANGIAKLNINLQPGDYIITAEYKGSIVSNNIKVLPILNATDISMKYRDGTQFKATLVDGQGKPYSGQSVTFNINGLIYYRITDRLGQAKLNINLMPGKYIITSSYNGSSIANIITISA